MESPVDTFNRPVLHGDFGLRIPPSQRALAECFSQWRASLPAGRKYQVAVRDYVMAKIAYISGVRAVDELDRLARAQSWSSATRKKSLRTLRVLLAWLGIDTPIPERDVYGAGNITEHYNTVRVAGFLQTKGLLAPDSQAIGTDEASVHRWVDQAPAQFQADLRA